MGQEAREEAARARKTKKIKKAMWGLIIFAALLSLFFYVNSIPPAAGKYDDFAKCIAQSSTMFYGAFWCPHCQNQKRMFGSAERYLPYVECSLADQSGQTSVCINAHIASYPTWEFKDGSRLTGEVPLETLAQKTGCALPKN